MSRFIEGEARSQSVLFPERLEDWIAEDNPVRAVDAFVEELDLAELGFAGAAPAETGRPAYHPAMLLKIYIYGYLNRIPSSRRLERETQRNVELMWLTGRLAPDFKTIADFRRDNGEAVRRVCREFIELSRQIGLFGDAVVAIDGSKFKAVNNRDKNFTPHKLKARMQQLEESIARYLNDLDRADREPTSVPAVRVTHLKEKIATVKEQVRKLRRIEKQLQEAPDQQVSLTDPDARSMLRDTDAAQKPTLRRFTMLADEREFSRLRTGGRVPYSSGPGQYNYADVGTNITFRALDRGEQVKIEYEVELSDVGRVDPETKNPTISQHKTSGSSAIPFGKPTLISSWEDATSKRHYEIEVTATRVIR